MFAKIFVVHIAAKIISYDMVVVYTFTKTYQYFKASYNNQCTSVQ